MTFRYISGVYLLLQVLFFEKNLCAPSNINEKWGYYDRQPFVVRKKKLFVLILHKIYFILLKFLTNTDDFFIKRDCLDPSLGEVHIGYIIIEE